MVNMRPLRLHSQPQARNHPRQIWETPLIAASHSLRPLKPPEAYKSVRGQELRSRIARRWSRVGHE